MYDLDRFATRFHFEMWDGISKGSEGGLNWQQMKIELVPFVRFADGSRLFDHNTNASDFDNYILRYGWSTGTRPFERDGDLDVCPQLLPDFSPSSNG